MKKIVTGLAAGLFMLGAAGLTACKSEGEGLVAPGAIHLIESGKADFVVPADPYGEEGDCIGFGKYEELRQDAVITVFDSEGKRVGDGWVNAGYGPAEQISDDTNDCVFDFTVYLPDITKNYMIQIGDIGERQVSVVDGSVGELAIGNSTKGRFMDYDIWKEQWLS